MKRVLITTVTGALALASPAMAGQIVYAHGTDLWVMNDDGSNAHVLATSAQVGGAIGASSSGDNGVSVQPNGTGVAFSAAVPAAGAVTCDGENHCPGLYSLVGGTVTRLTQAASNCATGINDCGGEDIDPAVTSGGNVVFYSFFVDSTFTGCGIYYCGYAGGVVDQFYSSPLDGSQTPVAWPLPPQINGTQDPYGFEPGFEGPIASDPADPTKIAYGGDYLRDLNFGQECGPTGDSDCYPLDIEKSDGTYNQTSDDDSFYYGLAFSQDGTVVGDIETGGNKGIWVYLSAQNTLTNQSALTPGGKFAFALADPNNVSGAGEFDHTISGITFVGSNEIVFSADNNLWSIPASCWANSTTSNPPTANCGTFSPTNPNVHQLTTDGTSTTPDTQPSWTSSTSPITAVGGGGNNGNNGNNGNTGNTGGNEITKIGLASRSVPAGKAVTIVLTLSSAAKVHVEVLRYVPASGHGRHRRKAHYKAIGQLVGSAGAGVNHLRLLKVHGHKLKPGRYELLVSAGGKSYTLKFRVKP